MEVRSMKQLMQREKLHDARHGRMKFMLECYKKHAHSWVTILCRNNEKEMGNHDETYKSSIGINM